MYKSLGLLEFSPLHKNGCIKAPIPALVEMNILT